jgi:hypothetical protein
MDVKAIVTKPATWGCPKTQPNGNKQHASASAAPVLMPCADVGAHQRVGVWEAAIRTQHQARSYDQPRQHQHAA